MISAGREEENPGIWYFNTGDHGFVVLQLGIPNGSAYEFRHGIGFSHTNSMSERSPMNTKQFLILQSDWYTVLRWATGDETTETLQWADEDEMKRMRWRMVQDLGPVGLGGNQSTFGFSQWLDGYAMVKFLSLLDSRPWFDYNPWEIMRRDLDVDKVNRFGLDRSRE